MGRKDENGDMDDSPQNADTIKQYPKEKGHIVRCKGEKKSLIAKGGPPIDFYYT